MTNETDLRECSAQIALVKRLLGPETFDLKKILMELEIKKSLLMKYKPRDYQTILKEIRPETIEIEEIEKGLEDKKARLEKEKNDVETERKKAIEFEKAEKIKALKAQIKTIEEVKEKNIGE